MNPDLTSPTRLAELFRRYDFRPRKRFGQNFLVDRNVLNKILDAAEVGEGDCVLEIGPGAGTVTLALVERGARVVAVEIDRDMVAILRDVLAGTPNVEVVNADILGLDLSPFLRNHFSDAQVKVIGNLPYYITSPILTCVLQAHALISKIVVMVQEEVADRLVARPGTKDYGSMSVFVQYYSELQIVARVSENVFFPPPEVSSAVVRLIPRVAPPVQVPSDQLFFDVVHCAFGQRRKTLLNSLSDCSALGLNKHEVERVLQAAGIDPARRAETVSIEEFATIARSIV